MSTKTAGFLKHRLLRKYLSLIHEDLTAVYARDLRKWLIVAPVIGLTTGLVITGVVVIILGKLWPPMLTLIFTICRGISSGIHRYRTHHAVSDSGSQPTFHGRNHPLLPRA
jgi:hypothetical protein